MIARYQDDAKMSLLNAHAHAHTHTYINTYTERGSLEFQQKGIHASIFYAQICYESGTLICMALI